MCVSRSVMSDSSRPRGMYPTRLLCPWIFQARILERVAISFSRGSSWPREWTQVSCTADRLYHESPATERESNKAQGGDETRCLSGTKMKVQHSHCPKSSLISSPLPFCSVLPKVQISLDIWDQSKNSHLREKSHKHADGSYYKLTVSNLNLAWS